MPRRISSVDFYAHMSYSLNSLRGLNRGYIGDYDRGF